MPHVGHDGAEIEHHDYRNAVVVRCKQCGTSETLTITYGLNGVEFRRAR